MEKEILKIMERDSRISPAKIATMLGISEDDVKNIIVKLEKTNAIRRYKTVIDWEKVGDERVFAFIDVRVSPSRGVGFDDVAKRVYNYPEVHSVYLVSGDYDLRVVVEGDNMREVAFFVAERLATIDGVLSTKTNFLLKKYKEDGDIFEEPEADSRLAISP